MIVLTAYCSLQPDKVDQALAACRTVREPSLKESGCERYDFFQSPDDPTKVVFVEEWTTRAYLEAHFAQPHFQSFFAQMSEFVTAPPDIRIFEATLS